MTGEELFLNELNFHIRQGISKKDLTDLINERLKQLTIPVVVGRSEQLLLADCPNKQNAEPCRNGGICPKCS